MENKCQLIGYWGLAFLYFLTNAGFLTLEEIDESEYGLEIPKIDVENENKKVKGKVKSKKRKVSEGDENNSSSGEADGKTEGKDGGKELEDEKKKPKQNKEKKKRMKKKNKREKNEEANKLKENAELPESVSGQYYILFRLFFRQLRYGILTLIRRGLQEYFDSII